MQCHVGILELALNKLYQELQRPGVAVECVHCACFAALLCQTVISGSFSPNFNLLSSPSGEALYTATNTDQL